MRKVLRKTGGFLLILLAALLLLLGLFRVRMDPVLLRLAKVSASQEASQLICQEISRKITEGSFSSDQIICFEKDSEGRITALRTNMKQINSLKSGILNRISQALLGLHGSELGIPLGNLLLPELFSGKGPVIPVRILSIRRTDADFLSHFTQAGINQTLHRLTMQVKVEGTILVLGRILNFSAAGNVLVAETIIVGQVPHTFS